LGFFFCSDIGIVFRGDGAGYALSLGGTSTNSGEVVFIPRPQFRRAHSPSVIKQTAFSNAKSQKLTPSE
jgi:hypothetical protein